MGWESQVGRVGQIGPFVLGSWVRVGLLGLELSSKESLRCYMGNGYDHTSHVRGTISKKKQEKVVLLLGVQEESQSTLQVSLRAHKVSVHLLRGVVSALVLCGWHCEALQSQP